MKLLVTQYVILFVVRQVSKYLESTDFDLIRKDLEIRLRDLIPGTFFDDFGIELMNAMIDFIKEIFDGENESIWEHIKSGDLKIAFDLILEIIKNRFGF